MNNAQFKKKITKVLRQGKVYSLKAAPPTGLPFSKFTTKSLFPADVVLFSVSSVIL